MLRRYLHNLHMKPIIMLLALAAAPLVASAAPAESPTLEAVLGYPMASGLAGASDGTRIAWVLALRGVRNVYAAAAPDYRPVKLTAFADDDGQEITNVTVLPHGRGVVFVRGGDHHADVDSAAAVNPARLATPPGVVLWMSSGSAAAKPIADGDHPAVSALGDVAFVAPDGVRLVDPVQTAGARLLFADRGRVSDLAWSPDARRIAFVSNRGDHAFIGVYVLGSRTITYLAPSFARDASPVWSRDGRRLAFVRTPGVGGTEPIAWMPAPSWEVRLADLDQPDTSESLWQAPEGPTGRLPDLDNGANLRWLKNGQIAFTSEQDGWPHIYRIAPGEHESHLATPGDFSVDGFVAGENDGLIFAANGGSETGASDRRHLYAVTHGAAAARPLTSGPTIEWSPVPLASDKLAFIAAGPIRPSAVELLDLATGARTVLQPESIAGYPTRLLVAPQPITYRASDGTTVHGQLFRPSNPSGAAVVFVHGGPYRQMLLGWNPSDYYSNAFGLNQYLAMRGLTVLSINYRLSTGYGRAFQHPEDAGAQGASEYKDVLGAAAYLRSIGGVNPARIGIWGGSYGGYLTALALARNSDIFHAGVDFHGVHDWSRLIGAGLDPTVRHEGDDAARVLRRAFEASPVATISSWRSPVLLIQGDDDRNVAFAQAEDLAHRLADAKVPFEQLVLPNEAHSFLTYASWRRADEATARFLLAHLGNLEERRSAK